MQVWRSCNWTQHTTTTNMFQAGGKSEFWRTENYWWFDNFVETLSSHHNRDYDQVQSNDQSKAWCDLEKNKITTTTTAQCAVWVVCFPSNQTSWDISQKLRLDKLFNIYLSILVRLERKHDSWGNCEFQTLDPWFPLKYGPVSTPSSLNMPLYESCGIGV